MLPFGRSQPVKLADELVLDARPAAEIAERSIAGPIEFWAQLGRALETLLRGERALALKPSGAARPISAAIASVDSPEGRRLVAGQTIPGGWSASTPTARKRWDGSFSESSRRNRDRGVSSGARRAADRYRHRRPQRRRQDHVL